MRLPRGWYPEGEAETRRFLDAVPVENGASHASHASCAAISPHAGWFFSGRLMASALASLDRSADTVAVVGGHLPAGSPVLLAEEDAAQTPLGELVIDAELRSALRRTVPSMPDSRTDNTVEALLPAVKYFFPNAKLLWIRLGADSSAYKTGQELARLARAAGRRVALAASSDLTHYGPNYGFCPVGLGKEALRWVKNVNDKHFIDAVLTGDPELVLRRAETEMSACSAGAVLCALGFASAQAAPPFRLLDYTTSADILEQAGEGSPPDSFVGYAAMSNRE
jgi:AmmeMemoRadiSam system protein B